MQCYERLAMYLQLNSDAVMEIPQLEYDPLLLDEVMAEFSIDSFKILIALDRKQRGEVISRINAITGFERRHKEPSAPRSDNKNAISIPRISGRVREGLTKFPTIFP
jgi:hypothetical protein